jgi:PKD repeat protein
MWYEGWYNFMAYHNVWTWLPGAGACDLNSNSGSMSGTSFLRGAFENGLTVGVGVTGEPYLTGHPQPEVFLYYILHGYNFAEASNLSYPGFKWRDIAYGDPIYNPNKPKTPIKDTVSPTLTQVYSITDNDHSTSSVSIIARIDQNTTMPEVATFKIEYGLDANYGNVIDFDEIYTMEKVFAIDNLSPGTTYHYKIYAKDPVGNITTSPDQTFKTMLNSTDIAPALNLSASAQIGDAPFTVNFDFSSSPMPTTYEWNFDNGDTSSVKNPTYTFNDKGVYRVILFAKFVKGSTNIGELLIIAK